MEFNRAMTALHKISPPPFSTSQILAIHHTTGGKKPMTLKQQIQVLLHISADNTKQNKIKILYEAYNRE